MKIIYIKGDLLEATESYILHGCNAQGVMGSGVAKAIREKWPKAYEDYYDMFKGPHKLPMGFMINSLQPDGKIIINAITQNHYGRVANMIYVDYEMIRKVMRDINEGTKTPNLIRVAMPRIGAGLGGGDWNLISKIIEEESTNFQPIVYEL